MVDVVSGNVFQAFAGFPDDYLQALRVEGALVAIIQSHIDGVQVGLLLFDLLLSDSRMICTVNNIASCDLVFACTHQRQFYLILNVFYMNRAARGHATAKDIGNLAP